MYNTTHPEDLPYEVLYNIVLNNNLKTILNYCSTSQYYNDICKDYKFWKDKIKLDFPEYNIKHNNFEYKMVYFILFEDTIREQIVLLRLNLNKISLLNYNKIYPLIEDTIKKILEKSPKK